MSSRALRKAQRLREQEQEKAQQNHQDKEADEDEEDAESEVAPAAKPSLFALLDEDAKDGQEVDDDAEEVADPSPRIPKDDAVRIARPVTAKKKKKNKGGGAKAIRDEGVQATKSHDGPGKTAKASQLDDIDLALRSLASTTLKTTEAPLQAVHVDPDLERLSTLLSIDIQHLNVANEMRRLFGRAALEPDHNEEAAPAQPGRRRGRGAQQTGLAGAVGGQNMPGGRGLAGLALRRNIFISGKDEWPRGTGGGLGMELVAQEDDGFTEYRFVHNRAYQDVQNQFESCVESMDPNRMVQLLQFNRKSDTSPATRLSMLTA